MGVSTKAKREKIYLFKNLQEMKGEMGENAQVAVEITDDDEGERVEAGAIGPNRRKLTSAIWMQFKRKKIEGQVYSLFEKAWRRNQNGTKHLHDHLRNYYVDQKQGEDIGSVFFEV
jgi:hypothetical protein